MSNGIQLHCVIKGPAQGQDPLTESTDSAFT